MREIDPVVAALIGIVVALTTTVTTIAIRVMRTNAKLATDQTQKVIDVAQKVIDVIEKKSEGEIVLAKALTGLQGAVADHTQWVRDTQMALREMAAALTKRQR